MENAADALKMAAAILIFLIAIASAFSLLGIAKRTADSIIKMRDRQAYLEASSLDTVLYTSSSSVENGRISGMTTKGDRIVGIEDVLSTIYRYNKEKYGVTIVKSDGTVLARYDTGTESAVNQFNAPVNKENNPPISDIIKSYETKLEMNTNTNYAIPKFVGKLKDLYTVKIETATETVEKYGAPWSGNSEETRKRINADIAGEEYKYLNQTRKLEHEVKDGLLELLQGKTIIEVTKEIDESQYLQDNGQATGLLQQYKMPTVEVIYIIED